ncbi:hypothetical protein LTR48_000646 [Friedmanniomyces endolithicus]|uniref:Uncharacterized protein n=1 Tax=Rachicladosporium monterosium TaxID=1507873 RepID=A0ABR0LFI4_9PEZI|nr:hypothetical protein LTR48_000646 [Friedmanniomyces endolithicus]KAK5148041.1 hypothetical protein LTR32_000622 [Rachicladosporium monterosium]
MSSTKHCPPGVDLQMVSQHPTSDRIGHLLHHWIFNSSSVKGPAMPSLRKELTHIARATDAMRPPPLDRGLCGCGGHLDRLDKGVVAVYPRKVYALGKRRVAMSSTRVRARGCEPMSGYRP